MRVTMVAFRLTAVGMALTAISACSAAPAPDSAAAPSPIVTASATPTTTPTLSPSKIWRPVVDGAGLTTQELGGGKVYSESTGWELVLACDKSALTRYVAMRYWGFRDTKPAMDFLAVYAYAPDLGTAVVDQARAAASACETWQRSELKNDVLGELTVTVPSGTDNTVAYCLRRTTTTGSSKGGVIYYCDAFMSRGHLVLNVRTTELTLAKAQSELKKVLPLAARASVRALPSL